VPEEVLAQEKLCPVLGLVTVATAVRGIDVARAVLRISGAGHSAAIHSTDPRTILDFGAAVEVLRVSVNAGASLGGAGLETNLALSMTIGTGFFGGSSLGSNLEPRHLVDHTTLAWSSEPGQQLPRLDGLEVWSVPGSATPAYPVASNLHPGNGPARPSSPVGPEAAALREEIRRLIVEELRQIVRG
jgi:acetaldehyde dehydrogenase / alcohol dehydrogenase